LTIGLTILSSFEFLASESGYNLSRCSFYL